MHVHHLALRTDDPERSACFYRDVLGLAERSRQHGRDGALRSIWLAAGPTIVMIERAGADEPRPPPGGLDFLAFSVTPAEREAFRARFAAAGIALEAETPNTLYVRDPDGRRVGVSSYAFA